MALRVHRTTPGYIVREELKRNKIRIEGGRKAASYECRKRWGINKVLQECIKKGLGRKRFRKGGWEEDRNRYFEWCGINSKEVNKNIEEKMDKSRMYAEKDEWEQMRERTKKIEEDRYWKRYKYIKCNEIPRYLDRPIREREIIAR